MRSVHETSRRLLAEQVLPELDRLRVVEHRRGAGARLLDFGAEAPGGLEAGRLLAELCLAGLGRVSFGSPSLGPTRTSVDVTTDHPVQACLASQYAGWPISVGDYFAMGSGPFRAARGREPLLIDEGLTAPADSTVGVLETRVLPDDGAVEAIARACGVDSSGLTLAIAPTASLAGMVQIVARSIETCLHKLHELKFPLARIESARGTAPLPPSTLKDRIAMGWTNDAILYGGEVTLWIDSDGLDLESLGPKVPSSASADYGRPFGEIFEAYGRDFYRIDPLLFSPASVTFIDRRSGRVRRFGSVSAEVLARSFGS